MIKQLLLAGLLSHLAKTCATITSKMPFGRAKHVAGEKSPGAPHVLTETPRSKIIFFQVARSPSTGNHRFYMPIAGAFIWPWEDGAVWVRVRAWWTRKWVGAVLKDYIKKIIFGTYFWQMLACRKNVHKIRHAGSSQSLTNADSKHTRFEVVNS